MHLYLIRFMPSALSCEIFRQFVPRSIFTAIVITAILTTGGCGYTFQGSGSILPPDVKRIYVPRVQNSTTEVRLTPLLTEALKDRFERFGVVEIADSISEADAILNAKIMKVKRETATVTSTSASTLQYDLTLTVAAELRRTSGPVLWSSSGFSLSKQYGTSGSVIVQTSPDFASNPLSGADLATLETGGTREVARGQEVEAFNALAEETAKYIYDNAVAPDF